MPQTVSEEKSSKLRSMLEFLAVLQWVLTFIIGGFGGLLLFIYLLFTRLWFVSVIYGVFYLLDRNTPSRGGRRWRWVREWRLFKYMANYFPATLHKTVPLNVEENYLLCCHPHGILAVGAFLSFVTEATGFSRIFPGITAHLCVLDGHFSFPFYRDYFMCGGAIAVNKRSIDFVLGGRKGRGNLVCLLPGGAAEALDSYPGKYKIHLKTKFGFVKAALKSGAHLVPCLAFGDTSLYNQMDNSPGTWLRTIQKRLLPFCGFSMPVFYGYGLAPFKRPIHTVIGTPIPVTQNCNPTKDDIAELKLKYIEGLRSLYFQNKPLYDPHAEDDLEIV